ncbi:VOC family protein [Chitinophaga pendula]|uniref:glyoxalase superfamily protein n=1 Tax=Chitinophaga TaxID=79328 RepID=UPI000BB073C5|nr:MULTISPECIES: glyoxalase superfamily protein [Chitinophaga]ASZ13308.1 glyoxalase [Chitinophaga sp. MD30]UCJ09068.1 VOC family protein [Chitinophaga pendula]
MNVKRIVANINAADIHAASSFYGDILGLDILMDHGWITTYGNKHHMDVQISIANHGGNDTPTPDLSIEVDDVEAAFQQMQQAGFHITYPLTDEPWGVRRFYVIDPFGKLVNILTHLG